MNETAFEILKIVVCAVIAIIGVLVTKVALPYISTLKLTAEQELVLSLVEKAVRAVEQTITESGQGKVKKAEVIKYIKRMLDDTNIQMTEEQIDKLIEAAVLEMHLEFEKVEGSKE